MYNHVQAIEVSIWGRHVGTIVPKSGSYYRFEYDDDFLTSGILLAPFELPLRSGEFSFLNRPSSAFYGMPPSLRILFRMTLATRSLTSGCCSRA